MSAPIPTLRAYGEYLESLERPLDVDALLVSERRRSSSGAAAAPDLDAPEPVAAHAMVADRGTSPRQRAGRRRWLVVAAAAASVAVIAVTVLLQKTGDEGTRIRAPGGPRPSVTTVPTPPTGISDPGFDALMRSDGVTPSMPETGRLVVSAWFGGDLGAYLLYADGRLLWPADLDGTPGWVERRLTPEGVERVRSEFLATGLFDDGLLPSTASCGPVFALLCVRDDGRLLRRDAWYGLSPEEQLLRDNLRTLPSSLPPTDWADPQIKAYVPAKYLVCLGSAGTGILDPSDALQALPPRAARLLDGREADLPAGFMGGAPCYEVATADARVLAIELVDAFGAPALSPHLAFGFAITAKVDQPHVKKFHISFNQALPTGEIALYYPALA